MKKLTIRKDMSIKFYYFFDYYFLFFNVFNNVIDMFPSSRWQFSF